MNGSKWSYIFVGANFMTAVFAALLHSIGFVVLNALLAVYGWYMAEYQRQQEDIALIDAYEFTKETLAKLKDEEPK